MDLFGFGSDVGGEGSKGEQSPNLTRRTQKLIDASVAIRGGAPDGDEIAFLHSTFCQVALPRTRPPGLVFERTSGAASIRLEAGTLWDGERHVQQSLPYGTRPRLLLMHMIRSYLRTRDRNIDLGESVRDFLVNTLHVSASGGPRGGLTSFRQQVHALAGCRISIGINAGGGQAVSHPNKQLIDRFAAWPIDESGRRTLLPHQLTLTREFAEAIEQSSVPLDLRAIPCRAGQRTIARRIRLARPSPLAHVATDNGLLAELARAVRPGGRGSSHVQAQLHQVAARSDGGLSPGEDPGGKGRASLDAVKAARAAYHRRGSRPLRTRRPTCRQVGVGATRPRSSRPNRACPAARP